MIITTSRKRSLKTVTFAKDFTKSIPGAFYKSRGKKKLEDFIDDARYSGFDFVLVVSEVKGNPNEIRCVKVLDSDWSDFFSLKISVKKLRKELNNFKNKIPYLKIDIKDSEISELFRNFVVDSVDSDYSVKEESRVISFFFSEKEIGPSFLVKGINYD